MTAFNEDYATELVEYSSGQSVNCYISINSYISISNFTLNLLEDSGWYKVNYAVAEARHSYELLWGKGELDFLQVYNYVTCNV